MRTIEKALGLLALFSEQRPAIGLSELARLARYDKATTHRYLSALLRRGFLEQDAQRRTYRLGPSLVRLARVREQTHPVEAAVAPVLAHLVKITEETAHFSMLCGEELATLAVVESPKVNRVIVEIGEALPLHATSSGLAYLAFAPAKVVEAALNQPLAAFTPATLSDPERIRALLETCRKSGIAASTDGYEEGVFSVAAPVFNSGDVVCGAVAVAAPISRRRQLAEAVMRDAVREGAAAITRALGGAPGGTDANRGARVR
ncbi:MAG: IclR family transcriptional regulator, partial [Alphaproteobacteria bacterium]|nr:IclR family transcriptional regulator [Alphaproteobacteria bacterium]